MSASTEQGSVRGQGETAPAPRIVLAHEADFVLGALRVSPSCLEVVRSGFNQSLEPRVMQVLVALYQARGAVLSREDLIARCWNGRIVGEDAINRAIGQLRRLSRTICGASFVIETIPRVGYRLRPSQIIPPPHARWWHDAAMLLSAIF